MNTCEWLDRVKEENQIDSDYKLAKLLGIAPNRISNYRNTHIQMDELLCLQVAKLLKINAGIILLDITAERTKTPAAAKIFKKISNELTSAAASLILTLSMIYGTVAPSDAIACPADIGCHYVYYVKSLINWILTGAESKTLFFALFVLNQLFLHVLLHFIQILKKCLTAQKMDFLP